MITKTITVYNLERFDRKLENLNKKVAKMGLQLIRKGSVVEERKAIKNSLLEDVEVFSHYAVEIILYEELVQFGGGWGLVAVIDHTENLVRSVPDWFGVESLSKYVERGAVCEHCHTVRQRNETFIITNYIGLLVQVGRDCVGQFLGISPERALRQIEVVREVLEDEGWLGERQVRGYGLEFFLSHAAAMIRTEGWRSRSAVKEQGGRATADLTVENIYYEESQKKDRYGAPLWVERTEADKVLAVRVVGWLNALVGRGGLNDYLSNLRQIGENGFVSDKSAGFAASAVVAFQKEVEQVVKKLAERAGKPESQYVGELKKRQVFAGLNLVKSFGRESEWGVSFTHIFLDDAGNKVVWYTSTELDQNCVYAGKATVVEHKEYKGERQTIINRAAFEKVEG
jgi:hypothetical protein